MGDEAKPGYLTTEFWVALGSKISTLVVAVLALTGAKPEVQNALGTAAANATIGVGAIIVFGWLGYSYIKSRTAVKVAAVDARATVQAANSNAATALVAAERAVRLP